LQTEINIQANQKYLHAGYFNGDDRKHSAQSGAITLLRLKNAALKDQINASPASLNGK